MRAASIERVRRPRSTALNAAKVVRGSVKVARGSVKVARGVSTRAKVAHGSIKVARGVSTREKCRLTDTGPNASGGRVPPH